MYKVEVSYSASKGTKIQVGQFSAESYMTIGETVSELIERRLEETQEMNPENISITLDLQYIEDEYEDCEED
jgi:hypothetical protein